MTINTVQGCQLNAFQSQLALTGKMDKNGKSKMPLNMFPAQSVVTGNRSLDGIHHGRI